MRSPGAFSPNSQASIVYYARISGFQLNLGGEIVTYRAIFVDELHPSQELKLKLRRDEEYFIERTIWILAA